MRLLFCLMDGQVVGWCCVTVTLRSLFKLGRVYSCITLDACSLLEFWIREDTYISVNEAIAISLRILIRSIHALLFVLLMSRSGRVLLHGKIGQRTSWRVVVNFTALAFCCF